MVLKFIKSTFSKAKDALISKKERLGEKIRALFSGPLDSTTENKLQKLLYEADMGSDTVSELIASIKIALNHKSSVEPDAILQLMKQEILKKLPAESKPLHSEKKPHIYLLLGVNGSGKTTSTAKLANHLASQGQSVLLGAADTFRAAATEQLIEWAKRLDIDIVHGKQGSDSAAVVFDALKAAEARKKDAVIIDTAGRLHTRNDLMEELKKIKRICHKVLPDAPCETLLVLDATIGQNAINQAQIFNEYTELSGLILTKLDGSAKGGVAISIQRALNIPLYYVGTGESIEDLKPYKKETYVDQLLDIS